MSIRQTYTVKVPGIMTRVWVRELCEIWETEEEEYRDVKNYKTIKCQAAGVCVCVYVQSSNQVSITSRVQSQLRYFPLTCPCCWSGYAEPGRTLVTRWPRGSWHTAWRPSVQSCQSSQSTGPQQCYWEHTPGLVCKCTHKHTIERVMIETVMKNPAGITIFNNVQVFLSL